MNQAQSPENSISITLEEDPNCIKIYDNESLVIFLEHHSYRYPLRLILITLYILLLLQRYTSEGTSDVVFSLILILGLVLIVITEFMFSIFKILTNIEVISPYQFRKDFIIKLHSQIRISDTSWRQDQDIFTYSKFGLFKFNPEFLETIIVNSKEIKIKLGSVHRLTYKLLIVMKSNQE